MSPPPTHTHPLCVLCAVEGSSKVLVVANDERTCYQLRQYLCEGGQRLLEKQLSRLNLTVDTTTSKNLKRSLPSQVGGASEVEGASKRRKTDTVEQEYVCGNKIKNSYNCFIRI